MRVTRKQRRARQRRERMLNCLKGIVHKGVKLATAALLVISNLTPLTVDAMPANGQVTAGSAVINQAGSVMTIQQQTNQAAINWKSFNIGAHEKVQFFQPGRNSVALNRVVGSNASAIYGSLTANGKVFLVNPNGVFFAPGASVNVGGLVATTLSISDADFMAGRYRFTDQGGAKGVINEGSIVADQQGLVALLAPEVKNEGIIVAKKGSVVLAAGNQATLDFTGDGKVQLALEPGALQAAVDNKGLIEADGGIVLMTARAGQELTSAVVNQSGIVRARSLDGKAGEVTIHAVDGTARVAGTIDASAATGKGGTVDVFGKDIAMAGQVDVSGNAGGGKVRAGGDWQGTGSAPHAQTVSIAKEAVINADAVNKGKGGTVAVWSDGTTRFDGAISARGGATGGDGGSVETSGHVLQVSDTARVNASAAKGKGGEWLLDPYNVTIRAKTKPDETGLEDASGGSYVPGKGDSVVDVSTVNAALDNGSNVTIKTGNIPGENSNGNQAGDITVSSAITASGTATLILEAHGNIVVNADITSAASGALNVDLFADTEGKTGGYIEINNSTISTNGGEVTLRGGVNGYATSESSGYSGVTLSDATITTSGGNVNIAGRTNNTTGADYGVNIKGATVINAGAGTVTIKGRHEAASGIGINFAATAEKGITAKNVTLIADSMAFPGAGTINGTADSKLWLKPETVGRGINIGTAASSGNGTLNLTKTNLFATTFTGFAQTIIGHESGTGAITVNNAAFNNDVTLQGANTINIAGALTAAGKTLTLKANTSVTDTAGGVITADELSLIGSGAAFTLNNAAHHIGTLAGDVQSVAFNNAGSFTVGTVASNIGEATGITTRTTDGLTITESSELTSSGGNVTISKDITKIGSGAKTLTVNANAATSVITVTSGATVGASAGNLNVTFNAKQDVVLDGGMIDSKGGAITLTAQTGKIQLTNGAKVQAGAGDIHFQSKNLSIMDGSNRGGTVTGSKKLTIDTYDASGTIGVGSNIGELLIPTVAFGTTAATSVFAPGFSEVIIGRADGTGLVTVGQLTVQDKLTVQSGAAAGKISFGSNAALQTNNKALLLNAGVIEFNDANDSIVEAGSGDLTLNADAITNWVHAKFDTVPGGKLFITPKTAARALQIGGTTESISQLAVTADGMTKIANGKFSQVTIGREDGSGAVTVGSFTIPATAGTILTVLSPGGDATISNGATIAVAEGNTLTFKVKSLTQDTFSTLAVDKLRLAGSGKFDLSSSANAVGMIAADVGGLKLYSDALTIDSVDGVNGITATGKVELGVNRLAVNQSVKADDQILQIYSLNPDKIIQVGGTDNNSDLYLASTYFTPGTGVLGGVYNKIILGRLNGTEGDTVNHNADISITGTTFSSNLEIRTLKNVNLSGAINVGNPRKNLTITANKANLPGGAGNKLTVQDLTLELTSGLDGLVGEINGANNGKLTVKVSDTQDIYISDESTPDGYVAGNDYKIPYTVINGVFTGFPNFEVTGNQHVFFDAGTINKAVTVASGTGNYGVTVRDNVGINLTTGKVDISGGFFTMNPNKKLAVSGNGAQVNIDATNKVTLSTESQILVNGSGAKVTVSGSELVLGEKAQINLGTDPQSATNSFTLKVNKLTAANDDTDVIFTNITGKGTLNLGTRDDVAMYVNSDGNGSGLIITQAQLNGGLFGSDFKDLVLGKTFGTEAVTINDIKVNNNVTIQNGPGGKIIIGAKGLTVGLMETDAKKVTLKAGTIENTGGGKITANSGTINLYTDNMDALTGTDTVTGKGTLGIGTYDGTKNITLGNDTSHGGLLLPDAKFGGVFGSGFSHYSIGNDSQGTIYVHNSTLTKDTTLTANNIYFYPDGGTGNSITLSAGKTLTLNAKTKAEQKGGVITASQLALLGGTYDLTASANKLGTLAANAQQVKVKTETLTIGEVVTPANDTVSGVAASGSGDAINLTVTNIEGLTVNKNISANGNITLTADTMAFGSAVRVSAPGVLTVQQYNAATTLDIGTPGTGKLQLGSNLFNGTNRIFQDGFSHIYLGRADGTGAVTVAGTLNFVDPTTIRSPGTNGSITVKENAAITTGNNSLEFRTVTLKTETGSAINTGSGTLTLTVDNLNLAGNSNQDLAPIQGTGQLILQTLTKSRNLSLGQTEFGISGNSLFLKSGYFDGTGGVNRVFRDGYSKIIIGQEDGTGTLTQTGTTGFTDDVLVRQASNNTEGKVVVTGKINTDGNNFSVSSKIVEFTEAYIDANYYDAEGVIRKGGNVSITADNLTTDEFSWIKSIGDLTIDTLTAGRTITIGGSSSTSLNLTSNWFDGSHLFRMSTDKNGANPRGFNKVTIGNTASGAMTIGDLTIGNGLAKTLKFTSSGNVTGSGKLTRVEKLEVSSGGKVSFTNEDNTITSLGNITAGQGIEIKNTGNLTIAGTVTNTGGEANPVNIWTKGGDITIAGDLVSGGSVSSNSDIYLTAKGEKTDDGSVVGGKFYNTRGTNTLTTTGTGNRWVVFTWDSTGNDTTGLTSNFRRYGTSYDKRSELVNETKDNPKNGTDYSGSGFAYEVQPVITIDATKAYGDGLSQFFATGNTKYLFTADRSRAGDALYIDSVEAAARAADSGTYYWDTINATTGVNNGKVYGTGGAAGYQAAYTGLNPLNYEVKVNFKITPRLVTVTANNYSKIYDGNLYTGGNGVTYKGFIAEDVQGVGGGYDNVNTAITADKIRSGVLTTANPDGTISYGGTSQGARNAGSYGIDINSSLLTDGNYTFEYAPGTLTISQRSITITTNNASRVYGAANPAVAGGKLTAGSLGTGDSITGVNVAVDSSINSSSNVGTYTGKIGVSGATFTNSDPFYATDNLAGNYNITYVNGDLQITPRSLIIAVDNKTRVYGEDNSTAGLLTYAVKAAEGDTGLVNGDTINASSVNLSVNGVGKTSNVKTYEGVIRNNDDVSFSKGSSSNYDITYTGGDFTITPRTVLVTADSTSRHYGNPNLPVSGFTSEQGTAGTGSSRGLVNGDTITSVTNTYKSGIDNLTDAGKYENSILAAGAVFGSDEMAGNYIVEYAHGTLTITPRPLTITIDNANRYYGGANPTELGGKLTGGLGLVGEDKLGDIAVKVANTAEPTANAGTTHAIEGTDVTIKNGKSSNYDITFVDGTLTIDKAPLVIKANDKTKIYDGKVYSNGYDVNYTGFVNNENTSVLDGELSYKGDSQTAVNVKNGGYVITPGGLLSANYEITYQDGTLTIAPKEVIVRAKDHSRVYDGTSGNNTNGYIYDGFVSGEGDANGAYGGIVSGGVRYGNDAVSARNVKRDAKGNVIGYTIGIQESDGSNLSANNYSFTYVDGMLTITPKALTITADDKTRTQSAENPDFTVRYDGLVNDEQGEDVVTGLTVTTPADRNSRVGEYDITPADGTAVNYEITYRKGILTIEGLNPEEDKAVKDAQTQKPINPSPTTPDQPGTGTPPQPPVQPDPAGPPVNNGNLPGLPSGTTGDAVIQTGNSSGQHTFVAENGGFGLQLNNSSREGESGFTGGERRTSGAVPVLFADGSEQKLDGIYTINYSPDKLSILPAAQGVTIPRLDEISPDVNRGFSLVYKTQGTGAFEVTFGNGIVSILPLDELAVATVTGENREAGRAVLATGILTAVEELGVMPDQIRAIYVFTAQANK